MSQHEPPVRARSRSEAKKAPKGMRAPGAFSLAGQQPRGEGRAAALSSLDKLNTELTRAVLFSMSLSQRGREAVQYVIGIACGFAIGLMLWSFWDWLMAVLFQQP